MGIIPPSCTEHFFHTKTDKKLKSSTQNAGYGKKGNKCMSKRSEKYNYHYHAEAVDRANRHIQKASVLVLAGLEGHPADFNSPANERPEYKNMKHLIKTEFYKRDRIHKISHQSKQNTSS